MLAMNVFSFRIFKNVFQACFFLVKKSRLVGYVFCFVFISVFCQSYRNVARCRLTCMVSGEGTVVILICPWVSSLPFLCLSLKSLIIHGFEQFECDVPWCNHLHVSLCLDFVEFLDLLGFLFWTKRKTISQPHCGYFSSTLSNFMYDISS